MALSVATSRLDSPCELLSSAVRSSRYVLQSATSPTAAGQTRPPGRPGPGGRPGRGRLNAVAVPVDGRASLEAQGPQSVQFQQTKQQGASRLVAGRRLRARPATSRVRFLHAVSLLVLSVRDLADEDVRMQGVVRLNGDEGGAVTLETCENKKSSR